MSSIRDGVRKHHKFAAGTLLIAGLLASLLALGTIPGFSADKSETIEAVAQGTSAQLGSQFGVTLNINDFSTRADRQILVQAFQKS